VLWRRRTIPGMMGSESPESAPTPYSAPQSERSKRRLIKWGVTAVVVLVGGWFAWHQYTAHQEATKTEHLTQEVEQSMQEKFDSDPKFSKYDIRVEKVALVKESGNKYDGIATVHTPGSSDHEVSIDVVADRSNMMWKTQPGAFLFLIQEPDLRLSNTPTFEASPTLPPPTPTVAPQNNPLPDADTQGFLNYQGAARCRGIDPAVLIVRTAHSAAVMCQSSPGEYYYRGLRLSDDANIELAGATPDGTGFSVTNPADGTKYELSRSGLEIQGPGQSVSESAVESAP
jgi:hypothetical protein